MKVVRVGVLVLILEEELSVLHHCDDKNYLFGVLVFHYSFHLSRIIKVLELITLLFPTLL